MRRPPSDVRGCCAVCLLSPANGNTFALEPESRGSSGAAGVPRAKSVRLRPGATFGVVMGRWAAPPKSKGGAAPLRRPPVESNNALRPYR